MVMPQKKKHQGNVKKPQNTQQKGGKKGGNSKPSDSPPPKKSQSDDSDRVKPDIVGGTASFQTDNRTDDESKFATPDNLNGTESLPNESSSRSELEGNENEEEYATAEEDEALQGEETSKEESSDKLNLNGDKPEKPKLSKRQRKNEKLKNKSKTVESSSTGKKKKKDSSANGNQNNKKSDNGKSVAESNPNEDEVGLEKSSISEKMDEGIVTKSDQDAAKLKIDYSMRGDKKQVKDENKHATDRVEKSSNIIEKMDEGIVIKDDQDANKLEIDNSTHGNKKKFKNGNKHATDRSSVGEKKDQESNSKANQGEKRSCWDASHSVDKKNEGRKSNKAEDSRDKSNQDKRKVSINRSSYSRENSRENYNRDLHTQQNDSANESRKAQSSQSKENNTTKESWDDDLTTDSCGNNTTADSLENSATDPWGYSKNESDEVWDEMYAEDERLIEEERRKSSEKKQMRRSNQSREDPRDDSESCITEINKDLFETPANVALAHCVGADLKMGSGIAVRFRQEFKRVGELMDQGVRQGGVAYIKHEERYVFYLVTKDSSTGKPTQSSMLRSLNALHEKCKELEVFELAIPRIGCGLDRLEWSWVKANLAKIFADGFKITVYNWNEEEDFRVESTPGSKPGTKPPSKPRRSFIRNENLILMDIERGTGLLYIASVVPFVTEEMKSLDIKYPFLDVARRQCHVLGKVIRVETRGEVVYGLVCRETVDSPIQYKHLDKALEELRQINRRDKYDYFGVQAFEDKNDPSVMTNIDNLLRNSNISREIWICWPRELQHLKPEQRERWFN